MTGWSEKYSGRPHCRDQPVNRTARRTCSSLARWASRCAVSMLPPAEVLRRSMSNAGPTSRSSGTRSIGWPSSKKWKGASMCVPQCIPSDTRLLFSARRSGRTSRVVSRTETSNGGSPGYTGVASSSGWVKSTIRCTVTSSPIGFAPRGRFLDGEMAEGSAWQTSARREHYNWVSLEFCHAKWICDPAGV